MPLQLLSDQQLQALRMQQRTGAVCATATAPESDEESVTTGTRTPLLNKRGVCAAFLWARVMGYRHWLLERSNLITEAVRGAVAWLRQNAYEPLSSCDAGSDDDDAHGPRTTGFRPATEDEIREKNAVLTVRRERYLTTHGSR